MHAFFQLAYDVQGFVVRSQQHEGINKASSHATEIFHAATDQGQQTGQAGQGSACFIVIVQRTSTDGITNDSS